MVSKLLNYDVLSCLGEGARSVIYKVSDPVTQRIYALKHVQRNTPKDIRFVEQMESEYEISKQFTHPGLRRTFDLKLNKSMLLKVTEAFLLMELFEGKSLDDWTNGTLLETVETFIKTADALRALHRMGYIHCDLKPNNILRNELGEVKVIDFGQSCKAGTVKERIQGTPDYISPEQVNRRPVSPQTDVYNLGATMYWSLTGKPIPTLYTVNKKGENSFLLDATIAAPSSLNPLVPPALSNLVMDSIATRKEKRPDDMEAVLQRLEISKHVIQKQMNAQAAAVESPAGES